MNKLLVAIFDHDGAADAGLNALRALHAAGDITLYATGVLARDTQGSVSVRKSKDTYSAGTVTGLAVGSLIGLLGGPVGMATGAAAGTVAGAVRDFWAAGVGLDFIEAATQDLLPGKVALVAEIEEERVIPVDLALEAAGGQVFRRTRTDVVEAQFDHDITAFKAEIRELESEALHASGTAKTQLQSKLAITETRLDGAIHRGQQRLDMLKREADAKAESLMLQFSQTKGDVQARIEDRMKRVKSAHHARGAKLAQAWNLTQDAPTA